MENSTMEKAFKSLTEFVDVEEPVYLKEDEESANTIGELLKNNSVYFILHNFSRDGVTYGLSVEGTHDGGSLGMEDGFSADKLDGVIVDAVDSENDLIGRLDGVTLDTPLIEAEDMAVALARGKQPKQPEEEVSEPAPEEVTPEFPEEGQNAETAAVDVSAPLNDVDVKQDDGEVEIKYKDKKITVTDVEESLQESKSFDLSDLKDVAEAKAQLDKSSDDGVEQIVDVSAESVDDLKNTYIGSIILRCPTCHTMIYKDPDELVVDEETSTEGEKVYNVDDECPHCGAKDGYELIGQVATLETDPDGVSEDPVSAADESEATPEEMPHLEASEEPADDAGTADESKDEPAAEEKEGEIKESLEDDSAQRLAESSEDDSSFDLEAVPEESMYPNARSKDDVPNDAQAIIAVPNEYGEITEDAFEDCDNLESAIVKDGTTSIGDYAFSDCYSLASVTIPNSVTSIGNYAFRHCTSLTSITIPNSVTSIGNSAFRHCSSLASVTIPNSVTSIGDGAFYNCSSLESAIVKDGTTSIGDSAFFYCTSLTSVTIPSSVTSIGDGAFNGCTSLTSVTIPNSVTSIGSCAFFRCSSLTSITIPNSVTSIGGDAFSNCSSNLVIKTNANRKPEGWSLPNNIRVEYGCELNESMTPDDSAQRLAEVDIKSVNESHIDRLIKNYLRETYYNVKDYSTESIAIDDGDGKMFVEGSISFKSGKSKHTRFAFESVGINKRGKIRFCGMNEMFSDKRAFTLVGEVKDGKLLGESFAYSYKIGETKVAGRISGPKKR